MLNYVYLSRSDSPFVFRPGGKRIFETNRWGCIGYLLYGDASNGLRVSDFDNTSNDANYLAKGFISLTTYFLSAGMFRYHFKTLFSQRARIDRSASMCLGFSLRTGKRINNSYVYWGGRVALDHLPSSLNQIPLSPHGIYFINNAINETRSGVQSYTWEFTVANLIGEFFPYDTKASTSGVNLKSFHRVMRGSVGYSKDLYGLERVFNLSKIDYEYDKEFLPVFTDSAVKLQQALYNGTNNELAKHIYPLSTDFMYVVCAKIGLSPSILTREQEVGLLASAEIGWGINVSVFEQTNSSNSRIFLPSLKTQIDFHINKLSFVNRLIRDKSINISKRGVSDSIDIDLSLIGEFKKIKIHIISRSKLNTNNDAINVLRDSNFSVVGNIDVHSFNLSGEKITRIDNNLNIIDINIQPINTAGINSVIETDNPHGEFNVTEELNRNIWTFSKKEIEGAEGVYISRLKLAGYIPRIEIEY